MDARKYVEAASQGSLDALKDLHSLQSPDACNQQACIAAARGGHLNILEYLGSCDHPCTWSADVCSTAASAGHIHILQWARGHGCPWDEGTFDEAWGNR